MISRSPWQVLPFYANNYPDFGILEFKLTINRQIDAKDLQIVRALQRDGRLSNVDLATQVNLSPSPCLRRVRLLEEAGIIRGYSADVDPKGVGLRVTAFIRITLQRHDRDAVDRFEESVRKMDEVLDCHLMTGEADYLLRVMVPDLEAYEAFVRNRLHAIMGINSINTSLVYGTVKSSPVFPGGHLPTERQQAD
ncbi:AsnC family transcriptional regulator [Dongia mobilis]|uniref:AsnC family transcriptional regulator n=1 Tax=Dongia mobilis TaxID=578943 RepID=A0A4R6WWN5_9PROT|nr:Lrp/AsnC family transcriptional regulator [Dongia mobilis]TDQ84097.1 AsnC family transcriptional regulator [Dongia mobilis]